MQFKHQVLQSIRSSLSTCSTKLGITIVALLVFSAGAINDALADEWRTGQWELTMTVKGVPGGGQGRADGKSQFVCLRADSIDRAEQIIFDAVSAQISPRNETPPRGAPKCVIGEVKRNGEKIVWQSTCEGPRGPMQGIGNGVVGANTATLQQRFELKILVLGSVTIDQTVAAKRVGDCN